MSRIELGKDSREFALFRDYWNLVQEYWGVEASEIYWEKVVTDVHDFREKYNTDFAGDLGMALVNELERSSKMAGYEQKGIKKTWTEIQLERMETDLLLLCRRHEQANGELYQIASALKGIANSIDALRERLGLEK